MLKILILSILMSGCSLKGPSGFSNLSKDLKATEHKTDLSKYKKQSKHIKIRSLANISAVDKKNMDILDQDRRHYKKLAIKLRDTLELKNNAIADLIRVIEMLDIENKINSRIAQKALEQLDKAEVRASINDAFAKGMSIISILALLGVI